MVGLMLSPLVTSSRKRKRNCYALFHEMRHSLKEYAGESNRVDRVHWMALSVLRSMMSLAVAVTTGIVVNDGAIPSLLGMAIL